MTKIDITWWKEFKFTDIFEDFHGSRLNKSQRVPGEIPFLTAGFGNRGVSQFVANDIPTYTNPITIDMFGNCFYQNMECGGDDNVYFFVNHNISVQAKLFVSTIVNKQLTGKYSYVHQFRQRDVNILHVPLPVNSAGDPDWEFMESYMVDIFEELAARVPKLQGIKTLHPINIDSWQEFVIGDLFTITKGKRLTKMNMLAGSIPFIGASSLNNGVTGYVGNTKHVHEANCLTLSYNGSVGQCFYQDEPFWASDDVNVVRCKTNISRETYMFVSVTLRIVGRRYAFIDKWTKERMEKDTVKLPVDSAGDPDWEYMERYMKYSLEEIKYRTNALSKID